MWSQQLSKRTEDDLLNEFLNEVFHPRLKAAMNLANKGDSKGIGIHQHRYNAKRALNSLLGDIVGWRKGPSGATLRYPCVADQIISLSALKVMLLIGKISFDSMETLDGYKHVDIARLHLESMQLTGQPLTADTMSKFGEEVAARAGQHTAGKPSCNLNDPEKARSRVSLCGTGLLMEMYVFQAIAWSRWGDHGNAMKFLEANELVKRLWDQRQMEQSKSDKKEKLDQLVATAESENSETQKQLASDHDVQKAALAKKLAERRARKSGSAPVDEEVATPTVEETPHQQQTENAPTQPPQPSAPTSSVRSLPALEWAHFPAFDNIDINLRLQFCGLESQDAIDTLTSQAASCSAQVLKNQESVIKSSYYCHRSLVEQSKALFSTGADPSLATEWITACMSLVDWYLLVQDLSHAEHCLNAIAEVVKRAKSSLGVDLFGAETETPADHGAQELRINFHYFTASLAYAMMKLSQATILQYADATAEVAFAQMYLNPLIPPEEFKNVPDAKRPAQPDWSFAERMPFQIPGVAPPRKELPVRLDHAHDIARLFQTLQSEIDVIKEEISVDEDCERFLESTRMRADALGVLFDVTEDPVFLKQRINILESIYEVGLNPNAFRNVLRQADYDCGSSCQRLAELLLENGATNATAEVQVWYEHAHKHFTTFTTGFHREISMAHQQGKTIRDVLDPSDFPALLLGEMKTASLLMKLGKKTEAILKYEWIVGFFNENPEVLRLYPDTREQKEQCIQLLELLGGKAPTGTIRKTSPPPKAGGGQPQQQRMGKQAMAPSTRVMAKARPKPSGKK